MKYVLCFAALLSSGCLLATGLFTKECSDGFVDANEECDDGGTLPGDGCGPSCLREVAAFTVAAINDVDLSEARFAIFTNDVSPVDITKKPDGVIDLDLSGLQLIISDKENLCELLAADAAALDNLPELRAIQAQVFRRAPISESEFIAGESLSTNEDILTAAFGAGLDSIFVGATVIARSGGVDALRASNPVFALNDGVVDFEDITATTLTATLTVTLTAERAAGPFDLDEDPFDDDLTPNVRTIEEPLELSVRNASLCSGL